jgi:hypothetical protein
MIGHAVEAAVLRSAMKGWYNKTVLHVKQI